MFAIVDKRASDTVKRNLEKQVDGIFEFYSNEITYNAISGHPDIFMFQDMESLILAPNAPVELINFLNNNKIAFDFGTLPVGKTLKESVLYNCLSTDQFMFCKQSSSDKSIQELCKTKIQLSIPQAYVRCSMCAVGNSFVTSDKGIVKVLEKNNLNFIYFDPSEIKIIDHKNGFIGGTMGVLNNKVLFLGNILKHKDGKALEKFINQLNKEIICLGNDYLYDGGGIFFVT